MAHEQIDEAERLRRRAIMLCPHGQLRRSCELCDSQEEINRLKSEQTPLGREIDLLRAEVDTLRRALARIAALDADRGLAALMQAKDIAAVALEWKP